MRKPTRYEALDGKVTWRVRFRAGHGRDAKQASETFDSRREAERFAQMLDAVGPTAALAQLYAGDQAAGTPTMDQLAKDHIKYRTGIEEGTRLTYTRLWDRTWGPHIGRIPANMLTDDLVRDATNDLAKRYSGKSLKNQRGLLAGVCDRAVDKGYLPTNPTKRLRLARGNEHERAEMRILTRDELNDLLEVVHPHYRAFVMFLAGTGCRYGEAVALSVADLRLDHDAVMIRRALKWSPDNDRKIGPTKTRKSKRTVVLPGELVVQLRAVVAGKEPDGLVFTAPLGGPIYHRTFWSDIWLPACQKLKLDPRPRIHDLRHTHAAHLLAAGIPIHVVQARLGHESIQTTVDTYGGLLPDAQIQAANAAAQVFRPAKPELES